MDDHHDLCNGDECATFSCASYETEQIQERVIELWLRNDCWIPGADYKRLAEALGVDPDRLENDRSRRVHNRLEKRWTAGKQLRWSGAPEGRELVSFRRYLDNGYAEVHTFDGSRNVPVADLLEL